MERKAKADKLQVLLYPHMGLLVDFKSSVGGDFHPHKLFSDVKFRAILKMFQEASTGHHWDKLCKTVVSFHKRWYSKTSGTTKH